MSERAFDPSRAAADLAEFAQRAAAMQQALLASSESGDGASARDAVWKQDKVTLYRYRAIARPAGLPPVLVVFALVNRPYILDLAPDRSLIRGLLDAGLDVYLIDWGRPDGGDRFLALEDYVERYLDGAVQEILATQGIGALNLLGVCQGGTLSLCHTALHPERVQNLVTMVTPVDFQTDDNLLSKWVRKVDVDRMVEVLGNVPGALLNAAFISLMPLRLSAQKYAGIADIADDPEALANFLRMERWIHDSPDQAGRAFAEFIRWFFQENRLVRGGLAIGGRPVDLRRITCPLLNIYAAQDHLVPPSASLPLAGLTGSRDYSAFNFDGGHIGIYVSRRAQELLPGTIAQWLAGR